jgi:flagellar M-ring protein FliF
VAIAVLYLILGVIRPAVRQMTAPPPPPEPMVPSYGLNLPPDAGAAGEVEAGEDPLERVRRFARDNPQVVANVIRQWVNDPQSAP